ncbi:hypothetical protein Snoj_11760 [Streptomyces nojiriensis]|uniref:Uncharacterized protein n=1 Tax=Streptomyces nojiriensis TaxID=66374 RepID=A0ABQ3SGK1_9ACTN|nr:hypothetical protein [Streptomyces nojiriensis]QTI48890.1 hypothetical protein JYK04_06757 [Streptomyces nojiriensis]GGS07937.1 hypothetical protein GCM10010205_41580 [Streptomyces nojiriensis]GHI67258.1 hypothetical protein Snoj_11760 [Streptomyces nojiriensis]
MAPLGRPWWEFVPVGMPGGDAHAYAEQRRAARAVHLAQTPAAAFRRWTAGLALDGACDDPATCPHTPPPAPGPLGTAAHLAGLPDDTLPVHLRCHVRSGFGPPARRWLASP